MLVPESLDLLIKVIDLAEETEKYALHLEAGNLPELVPDHAFQHLRKEREPQRRMPDHAPQRKADHTIRVIDRTVKIIYVHIAVFGKRFLFEAEHSVEPRDVQHFAEARADVHQLKAALFRLQALIRAEKNAKAGG